MQNEHIPVLLDEAIAGLNINPNGIYVDCTLGGAGHASEILRKLSAQGFLYCFDQDNYSVLRGKERLASICPNFTVIEDNFLNIKKHLEVLGVNKVDGILYDLGVSSFQFDIGDRGFSYNYDAFLDMRMNQDQSLRAYDIVNGYSLNELKKIFYEYSEERFAPSIAKRIIIEREKKPIETTFELVEIIKRSISASARRTGGHPAKKVFQALRIAVNNELEVFDKSLKDALTMLNPQGRIVVISFHSLEDKICKANFREKVEVNIPRGLPIKEKDIVREYRLINNKVITASPEELERNNRAHSAKLRIIEKL
ncbi:MAG TPA: 16S rRNA (cytosine(1402)-N(4))-methyltransferase RsmH [Bacilli bacterium]|nr:16S rRNA (cytosine(1402)-N(4))-methyltransferase RsmH [Bacilli bacterium]